MAFFRARSIGIRSFRSARDSPRFGSLCAPKKYDNLWCASPCLSGFARFACGPAGFGWVQEMPSGSGFHNRKTDALPLVPYEIFHHKVSLLTLARTHNFPGFSQKAWLGFKALGSGRIETDRGRFDMYVASQIGSRSVSNRPWGRFETYDQSQIGFLVPI